MPVITHRVWINASLETCFDFARSIDAHMITTLQTKERAVGGVTSGLIEKGQSVTWEAVHFGIKQRLTAKITEMNKPSSFTDEMVEGAFHSFIHTHEFFPKDGGTLMVDSFSYTSPYGWMGKMADVLFLKRYMDRFMHKRVLELKRLAEEEAGLG